MSFVLRFFIDRMPLMNMSMNRRPRNVGENGLKMSLAKNTPYEYNLDSVRVDKKREGDN